jgi:transcriptional regulator with XRE-family HTH domain
MRPGVDHVASEIIRDIRRESGLNQAELARRAGMARSVLSAYEHGHRQPSAEALARIATAAGLEIRAAQPVDRPKLERAARILSQVLDLAEALPQRRRGALDYPSLRSLAA